MVGFITTASSVRLLTSDLLARPSQTTSTDLVPEHAGLYVNYEYTICSRIYADALFRYVLND